MVLFGRYIRKLGKLTQDKVAESSVIVNESLTGIVNVKSFANEAYEVMRYGIGIKTIKQVALKSAIWRGMFGTFIIIFLFGALGAIMGYGAYLRSIGELPQLLVSFVLITGLVAGSIGGLAAQMGTIQRSVGIIEGVMDILAGQPEKLTTDQKVVPATLRGAVRFDQLHFHYPSRPDIEVLKGLSFVIEPGQQVALVGASGSGKSTLAALLLQFYLPQKGRILFDDKEATSFQLVGLFAITLHTEIPLRATPRLKMPRAKPMHSISFKVFPKACTHWWAKEASNSVAVNANASPSLEQCCAIRRYSFWTRPQVPWTMKAKNWCNKRWTN
jgi:ABC-type multidrug transport system fused ATPase/permease subunit